MQWVLMMKVRELIEELQQFADDVEVHFSYNYGDHWRTTVAPKANYVELLPVVYSQYHSMPKVIGDEDDVRYNDADKVVVITS